LNKLKGTLELLGDGLKNFNFLSEKKSFWVAYVICVGLFDIVSAIYATNYPDQFSKQFLLDIYIGGNLIIFLDVFILLILSKNDKIFGPKSFSNLWRVWITQFVAGIWIGIGFIFLLIPGLLLSVRYIYSAQIALLEGLPISQTLKRSRELSTFNGGRVFIACALVFVLYCFILFFIGFLLEIVSNKVIDSFAYNYFLAVSSTLMTALICSVAYSGYVDVKTFELAKELKSSEE
tara:strand:+ start:465 stop:1166 length:702 start_codon:yes stop_codon:yes gene_type:complete